MITLINFQNYADEASKLIMAYAPKFLLAVITLIVGFIVIKGLSKGLVKLMQRRGIDESLQPFLRTMFSILLKILLIISVMSMVGVAMTSFIAILAAAGLAVGMALSGTLQNFAGGVMILVFKPFKVGDYIEAQGHAGTVSEIQIFNTILKSVDNRKIILPNAPLSSNAMVNYSSEPERRVDFTFGIGYQDDIDKAKQIISQLINADSRILNEPEPFIAVAELADSSVNLVVRTWVKSPDYWGVFFDMNEKLKKEFDKQGVSIPFPQTDVHVHNN